MDVLFLTIASHKNPNGHSDWTEKRAGTHAINLAITRTVKHGVTMVMTVMVVIWEVIVPGVMIWEMHIAKQYATHHVQRARHGVPTHTPKTDAGREIGAHPAKQTATSIMICLKHRSK